MLDKAKNFNLQYEQKPLKIIGALFGALLLGGIAALVFGQDGEEIVSWDEEQEELSDEESE